MTLQAWPRGPELFMFKSILFVIAAVIVALYANVAHTADIDKVVYGTDGRMEVYESQAPMNLWAKSTAVQVPETSVKPEGDNFRVNGTIYQDSNKLCDTVSYGQQPSPGRCSGFLVAPDVLVTAGHCIRSAADCSTNYWIFDFAVNQDGTTNTLFTPKQVYRCASIVAQQLDRTTKNDFAVIRLDRVVENRSPLKFRTVGKIADNADLVVIGNPSGIPTKVTLGGTMRTNDNSVFFTANLDTFSGNSGSAVFDVNSGLVEGILVRGESDFIYNQVRSCNVIRMCREGGCRGEDVTRITNLTSFLPTRRR